MKKHGRPGVLRDPEVLELLHNEPELLAIADAIHATLGAEHRRRWHRRRAARLSAVAAVPASVAATLVAAQPWRGGGGGIVEEALAAVPARGPVVHAVLRAQVPGQQLVEIASGRSLPELAELEFWYDERRGLLHTRVRREGSVVGDILASPSKTVSDAGSILGVRSRPILDPSLLGFATEYRDALIHRRARPVGRALAGGRAVVWLEIETALAASGSRSTRRASGRSRFAPSGLPAHRARL